MFWEELVIDRELMKKNWKFKQNIPLKEYFHPVARKDPGMNINALLLVTRILETEDLEIQLNKTRNNINHAFRYML